MLQHKDGTFDEPEPLDAAIEKLQANPRDFTTLFIGASEAELKSLRERMMMLEAEASAELAEPSND